MTVLTVARDDAVALSRLLFHSTGWGSQLIRLPTETEDQSSSSEHRLKLTEVTALIAGGLDRDEAAAIVGVQVTEDTELPSRFNYQPTPAQIVAECRMIQATWSERERKRRLGETDERFEFPVIRTEEIGCS